MMTENIHPISEGENLRIERIKELRKKSMELYSRLVQMAKQREWFIEAELQKTKEKQDFAKIVFWHEQVDVIEKSISELDETILNSYDIEEVLVEKVRLWEELIKLENEEYP